MDALIFGLFPWIFTSSSVTFALSLRCQQTENMEKAEKLRPAQSFPFLCHSPRTSPECRAVALRKSVSVSELVARYQSILDSESTMSKQEHPKLMERRRLSQNNVSPMGKKHALSQSHHTDMSWSKSMEDLPIPNINVPARNLKGLLTSFDTPKTTQQCKTLPFAPLKTPSPNGILRKREADARIMTTIQPLSMKTKPHKDPSFPSPLQTIQRKAQWGPDTIKWKESPVKGGKLSHNRQAIISSVPDTADDSATGRSYERTRSFLDISGNTSRILRQGQGRSSAPSVKELSALYLSQTAAAADAGSPPQPSTVKDNSIRPPHSQRKSKPMLKEVCASCLQPVYSMERVVTDKVCLHRSCFCCQVCGRKLSLQNYAALHGVFYCQVHHKQMAGAKSRSETERLEHWLGDHQVRPVATVGRGPQPQDWYNRTKKETETREKPTSSFNARCSLRPAEHRQELKSSSVLLGNKLRMGWPPSEIALLAVDGKAGKGACFGKKPTLSLQTFQAAGSRVGRVMLRGQEGKPAVEAAVGKGSFLPGVTYTKEIEQACSWPKNREQGDSEKMGDVKGKRGGKVSQRVAAIQQGKAQSKRGPASAFSSLVLEPVKSLPRGSLDHHTTRQSTKPTNWMYLGGTGGCILPAAELPVKGNKVCGSLSIPNEGDTTPAMTDDKPEPTIATPATAGDKHHLGERMNSPQPVCVSGEPKIRNTTSGELKSGAEGVGLHECEVEHEGPCLSGVSGTPHAASGSLEPGGLGASPETPEVVHEKSEANTKEFPGKQIPVISGENMQPSSINHFPGTESKGEEFEKTVQVKPVSMSGFLEEPSPEKTFQEKETEKRRVSSPGLPEMTGDHSASCLQETEPQATCGPLITNPPEGILRHDVKSPDKDLPVSAGTSLQEICATLSSHNEVRNSNLKVPPEVLSRNTSNVFEQSPKTLDSSKLSISSCKSGGHPVEEEKMDLKLPGESAVHTSRPDAQRKETRSSQACRDMPGKSFRKNPFTTLFGSEDKGSTPKKENTTQRKATKPQSALATLFGYSSEKKQSQQENPARSSEHTNVEDRQEKPQDLLSSSSQAKQKTSKNDQLPQPRKAEVTPKHIQERSGSCSDSTEGKETDILLLSPGTIISWEDKHERTELDIHDQLALNSQVQQQQDSFWSSLMPKQKNEKEAAVTLEGETNLLHPPPELMSAADNNKKPIREGNHYDAHPLEVQNLLSLDVQDTEIEDEIFFSPDDSEKLPKEAELQLDNIDFLEDNSLFFSGEQDFPITANKITNSDLQNSEAETIPCFDPNPSELCQEIPALELWDTSNLSLLAGQDEIITRDLEGIQSCALLQQLDPQHRAPKAAEDTLGLGVSVESSPIKHLSTQEDNFPTMYMFTSHASEALNHNVFDPFSVDSAEMSQEVPEKMSRKTSGFEEAYESLSSADPNMLNDDLLEQEFFI